MMNVHTLPILDGEQAGMVFEISRANGITLEISWPYIAVMVFGGLVGWFVHWMGWV